MAFIRTSFWRETGLLAGSKSKLKIKHVCSNFHVRSRRSDCVGRKGSIFKQIIFTKREESSSDKKISDVTHVYNVRIRLNKRKPREAHKEIVMSWHFHWGKSFFIYIYYERWNENFWMSWASHIIRKQQDSWYGRMIRRKENSFLPRWWWKVFWGSMQLQIRKSAYFQLLRSGTK